VDEILIDQAASRTRFLHPYVLKTKNVK